MGSKNQLEQGQVQAPETLGDFSEQKGRHAPTHDNPGCLLVSSAQHPARHRLNNRRGPRLCRDSQRAGEKKKQFKNYQRQILFNKLQKDIKQSLDKREETKEQSNYAHF